MRIDCQSHIFPRAYIDVLAQNPYPPQIELRCTAQDNSDGSACSDASIGERSSRREIPSISSAQHGNEFVITYGDVQQFRLLEEMYLPKRKLQDMDRAGIDMALISTNIPGPCMLAPHLAIKGAQAINDAIAEMIQQHPDRFAGLASLPWQDVDATIDEMDRAHNLGFCGVMLYSHIGGRPVDDPAFDPIYNHAQTKELPIVLHPTVPTWGEAIKDHSMIPMMGLQVDTSFALLRLILGGVLERHPRLKVVMPHVGGVLPYMMGRIEHQTEVMGRGREHIKQPPSTYMRGIYLDTVSPSAQALRYAYEFSGPEHLVFGTDHPWVDPQLFVTLIEEMDIPDSEKTQIFGGNAAELFGLSI
ncbi:2-amino-3-carboxymuconate-6-semialdehyde decarboxylase [Geodia barretti]|uniref:2-amino-3-carboxymuconate-6-semialdehyde decarboxylase n=1 Tax=Geodia barretti TaxID=519541 RepID=A0AA35X6W0_GEOBA|nr:2-amino-3-carboxymuconate-6-semialdehyde decarboxylase [Geodia barretti]